MAKHHKKGGGQVKSDRTRMWVSGNPDVKKEAYGEEPYDKGDEKKKGGRVKRKTGGVVKMTGGVVRPRLDRPGRKRGGRVGSDTSPLTSAHNTSSAEKLPNENDGD